MMQKMIVANWKMHGTKKMLNDFFTTFTPKKTIENRYIFCLPFTLLDQAAHYSIELGGQNCAAFEEGAYTGEISANMLKEAHCSFCLVGHSERRLLFQENSNVLQQKVRELLKANITPIYCIGESAEDKERGATKKILEAQLSVLDGFTQNIIIAYEPIWAIGTNKMPTISEIEEIHAFIKNMKDTQVLYGGSVSPENAQEIKRSPFVDGLLVGRASLKAESLLAL